MPWTDARTTFVTDTAIGASTGTELVGDVINLSTAGPDIGVGRAVYVHIYVTEAFDSDADGASVELQLVTDDSASIATDGSATVHWYSGVIAEADWTLGKHITFVIPAGIATKEQYVGLLAVTSGEALTAGKITAYIGMDDHDHWTPFAEGNN